MLIIRMEDQGSAMVDMANQNMANNSFEIIRKITQMLDEQIDSSNLANFMSQHKGQSKIMLQQTINQQLSTVSYHSLSGISHIENSCKSPVFHYARNQFNAEHKR